MCDLCDQYEVEDARHFLCSCSYFQTERDNMLFDMQQVVYESGATLTNGNNDLFLNILGKPIDNLTEAQMEAIWFIILEYVAPMYLRNVNHKSGIG